MQGTFLFVHGTGVRRDGYDALAGIIQERLLASRLSGVTFVGCSWGEAVGVKADRIAETLPPAIAKRGSDEPTAAELEAAAWGFLIDDPCFELRLASEIAPPTPGRVAVGGLLPAQAAVDSLRALRKATLDLNRTGLSASEIIAAADAIAAAPELHAAANAAGDASDPDLVLAEARAITAHVIAAHRMDPVGAAPHVATQRTVRDDLVTQLQTAIAPAATKGMIKDWIKGKVTAFAKRRATAYVLDRRESITGMSLPALGDILYYQRRGDGIRDHVARALAAAKPPIVAVGHSLGGIILVDLLSRPKPPPIDLLVTAGSQSPILFAIDALDSLRLNDAGVKPFVPWLNIYDRADILSYRASRIFSGAAGIVDEEVVSGVPFPDSHSAYWGIDRVYELIATHWPSERHR